MKQIIKKCPNLLTKYSKFIRQEKNGELSYGQFGCPFLEYNKENIGIHYYGLNDDGDYIAI